MNLEIDLSLNEYLCDVAQNIANKNIANKFPDNEYYLNEGRTSFASGNYYFHYYPKTGYSYDSEECIAVHLRDVLKTVMKDEI